MYIKLAIILTIAVLQVGGIKNKSCTDHLRELANAQMLFVHCATIHSVPVTFCASCEIQHLNLKNHYDDLRNESNNCTGEYFDNDRLNLVAATEAALTSLWKKGFCDDCYSNDNSTMISFDEKNSAFYGCLGQHARDPCDNCALQYLDLNNFYIQMDQHNNGQVCFDIQDSMNRTRYKWSKELKCCKREFNMTLFTVALGVFISLPFLFYGGAYIVTKRQERNHGILNDEDPLFSSPSSSSGTTMNITANLPAAYSATQIPDLPKPSISSSQSTNRPKSSKGFNKFSEEIDESSDEENLAKN